MLRPAAAVLFVLTFLTPRAAAATPLDDAVSEALTTRGFTGRIEQTLEGRVGRPIDHALADVGRLLFFDSIAGLNDDNSCAGCHAPHAGFADTQPIAIGVDSNGIVGTGRTGPRNKRRSPTVINTAFYPRMMWDGRFASLSGDPFDNSDDFAFPAPEGTSLSDNAHLLVAQAFLPPVERGETAGFSFQGDHDDMRAEVEKRLNAAQEYTKKFGALFPEVKNGGKVTYSMFARAIAEFEFTLTFANAPIDKFARGHHEAMTDPQKRGAVLFFGKARCVRCHAVSGRSNEMFSDFLTHVLAVPQIVPSQTNMDFDGPDKNEDYGLEEITQNPADRYKFRTSPLRNLATATSFMHDGAFTTLEEAVSHSLDVRASVARYTTARLPADLRTLAPMREPLSRLDSIVTRPVQLTPQELADLVDFVRNALTDERDKQSYLERLIPSSLPSGRSVSNFKGSCSDHTQCAVTEYCDDSACEAKHEEGASCSSDAECETGLCKSGTCKKPQGVTCKEIVRSSAAPDAVTDAWLSGDQATWAAGAYPGATIGKTKSGNDAFTLVRFDLTPIPSGAHIRTAKARIYFDGTTGTTSLMDIAAHPVLESWDEQSVTWNNWVKAGAWDFMPFWSTPAASSSYTDFDIAALVADWVSGAQANRGIMLREPKYDSHSLYTSETGPWWGPRLEVCYSM